MPILRQRRARRSFGAGTGAGNHKTTHHGLLDVAGVKQGFTRPGIADTVGPKLDKDVQCSSNVKPRAELGNYARWAEP